VSAPRCAQAPSQPASEIAAPRTLVERFLAREVIPLKSYRAIRRLHAENRRFKMDGWLEAETTLSNNTLTWKVLSEGGSGPIRNRVLRKALDGEADLVATGQGARGAFTLDNYEFAGTAGRIELRPRRRDTLLISGSALVSEENAELLEINGRLTKNPSFWTRDVDIRRCYASLNGVRVPIAMESVAQVRFAGPSRFEMTYRYLEVNGTAVDASADGTREK
jgi:hypothetical protein